MKKKIFPKIVCVLLSVCALFATACGGKGEKDADTDGTSVQKNTFQGMHVYDAPETDGYLLQNGKTEYKLVIPSYCSSTVKTARDEFLHLFKKATNVQLSVLLDGANENDTTGESGLQHSAHTKYISIGETSLLRSSGIAIDRMELGDDGGRIVTKDENVYLVGGGDTGTLFSVYTFMSIVFDFEQYYKDCMEIDTGVTQVKMRQFNVTDIPDFEFRANNYGAFSETSVDYDENNFRNRMRIVGNSWSYPFMPIHEAYNDINTKKDTIHNVFKYLPKATYQIAHPEWFADSGRQICYTAHGDENSWELMAQECAKKVENSLMLYTPDVYPDMNTATLTMEDNSDACTCADCTALNEQYQTDAAGAIRLVNRVAQLVDEWMDLEENKAYKREKFTLIFFAYNSMVPAPAVYNESAQKWEPMDESVKLHENVGVFLAPNNNFDYQTNIYAAGNDAGRNCIDAWAAMCDKIYFWTYSTNFSHYFYMHDSFSFFDTEGYQYFAAKNAKYIFNQSQFDQRGAYTAWHCLKMYLDSKMLWNSSLNTNELIDRWFNAMFKEAAPIMKTMFTEMRLQNAVISKENGFYVVGIAYFAVDKSSYWPLALLNSWRKYCDSALETVERYQDIDPTLYEQIRKHIEMEWLSPAFMTLSLHKNELSQKDKGELVSRFSKSVKEFGMLRINHFRMEVSDFIGGLQGEQNE